MPVTHCICFDVSFETLKAYAKEHRCGIDELSRRFGCGRGCALCVPYVKEMLRTGRTRFEASDPPPAQENDADDASV